MGPFLHRLDGKTFHPLRHNLNAPRGVVLSMAEFPEPSVFNQLSPYVNFLFGKCLMAEIYRPGAEMPTLPELAETKEDILEATVQAGREIVQSGSIRATRMERITQPIGSRGELSLQDRQWENRGQRGGLGKRRFDR
ncbi:MAG: hypothetical protein ABSG35_04195 [Syntrophobacteraceae bacterium]